VKFSKDYVMFCHITTQIQGDKHANLLEEKKGEGWPHFVFMDAEGSILAIHEEEPSAAGFAKTGEKVKAFAALKEKAAKGDKAAQVDLILIQLEMGQLAPDEAEKKMKEAKPSKEQEAKFAGMLMNATILKEVEGIGNEQQEKALAKKYYEAFKAGKPGPTGEHAMQPYYVLILSHAEEAKDAKGYASALKTLQDKFGKVEAAKEFFEKAEKTLKNLQAAPEKPDKK
jgi:hypothetical protein